MKEHIELDFSEKEQISRVAKALSSNVRLDILEHLREKPLNISEISEAVGIPISSTALHIKVLEDAGIVITQSMPGLRGSQRVCGLKANRVTMLLMDQNERFSTDNVYIEHMPIGNYFDCQIKAPCGIASEENYLSSEDSVYGFYSPEKSTAQILWFTQGYLEYRFPNIQLQKLKRIKSLEFSFEICSEAPGYNNFWKSDISFWINGTEIGFFTSPGDFGGRHGKLSPAWWDDNMTQFGLLKSLTITNEGTFIDGAELCPLRLNDYNLRENPYISLKIGVKEDAHYVGGLNLFGQKFGDYPQDILMKITY
ncbi:MAG: helix-turn-helix domain-containing protein [Eubacteriales bacterium]|nr:helix-turn-helix domain-containing protein [Eubacteriales bacterium]